MEGKKKREQNIILSAVFCLTSGDFIAKHVCLDVGKGEYELSPIVVFGLQLTAIETYKID